MKLKEEHKKLIESFNNAIYSDTQIDSDTSEIHIYFRATKFAKEGIERELKGTAIHMIADCYRILYQPKK